MPENQQDEEIVAMAQEISDYLMAHPNAADSLEGVVRWWLTRQRYDQAVERVQKALDFLVVTGMVAKKTNPDGKTIYMLAESKNTGV